MTYLLMLTLLLAPTFQTQEKPLPDRWRGLVINESTPEDAIRILGEPKKDRAGGLRTYPLNKRLVLDHNAKGFRKLRYENLDGVKEVELVFKDNLLVAIELQLKPSIPATTFPNLYDLDFTPKVSAMDTAFKPRDYERHEGNVYPKHYPVAYHLIAVTDKTYVSAFVTNSGTGAILFGSERAKTGPEDKGGFPGKVESVQIISRTLENKAGTEALK